MDIINELKKRAENLEESLIDIHIKTEGKVSLTECYSMPYKIRQIYYKEIEFSENTILNLHEMMMKYSGDPSAGQYKKDNNLITEVDREGNRRIRFKPISAKETPKEQWSN